jgi:hypothetical protein
VTGIETPGVWSAEGTTPSAIEAALRHLLEEQHQQSDAYAPARVLNMIAVVDREWRGEIENRLARVGRYHPSRTILCSVEKGRTRLDAWASMGSDDDNPEPGVLAPGHERIVIECGPQHTIVDPLVITDLATVIWAPHGHHEAIESLKTLAQVVLLDSIDEPDLRRAIERAEALAADAYVVDLAWLRSTPWRERISATFDPPALRAHLKALSSVTVRHRPDSNVAGLLLFGWLASRLGWEPGSLVAQNGSLFGRARGARQEVSLRLEPDERQSAPGLAGISIETALGMSLSLDRGAGGLSAYRKQRDGRESRWTVMGASRGEAGILGEGIRQALLRDPTYGPALNAAAAMLGS